MRAKWTPVYILSALGVLLALFQNCTNAVPFGDTDYFMSLVNSSNFPYEVRVDQVAYLSCSEQSDVPNNGHFFTFRVGAFYEGAGIRVTQDFRDNIEKVDKEDVPYALQQSPAIGNVRLQLGIRTVENLQLLYMDEDHAPDGIQGFDFYNFFPEMNDEALVNLLWNDESGSYLRNYPNAQFIEDYSFAGELKFMQSQSVEYGVRSFLHDKGLLAVTFAEYGEINPIGPATLGDGEAKDAFTNVFGMGLKPRFKQPSIVANPGSDMPPRVLSDIQEVRIDGRLSPGELRPWLCPSKMQFTIVLPEDATFTIEDTVITRCLMQPDPANPSPELEIVRQSLYVEDWWVDMDNHCIVPKGNVPEGACYGKDGNLQVTHKINYNSFASEGCGFSKIDKGLCPHYASVCYRQ